MFSEANGKSIMKKCNLLFSLLFFGTAIFIIVIGCGNDSKNNTDDISAAVTDTGQSLSQNDELEALMNEAMDRLRYQDKTFIYENEFRYYRDKFTYDDYLKERAISLANADTLEHIDVINSTFFGKDSVKLDVDVIFKGPSGKKTVKRENGLTLYWHEGKWIKPTVSNIIAQKEYEDIIEKAKSASQSEKQRSGN